MALKRIARLTAVAVALTTAGLGLTVAPAAAAQNNSFSLYYTPDGGSPRTIWENYTRSHTSTSNINYTGTSGLGGYRMYLRYTSNYAVFANKLVGTNYGTVRMVSNWGATRFQVGINAGSLTGWTRGTLYY